jgi:Flp pilus assembly protein TadG
MGSSRNNRTNQARWHGCLLTSGRRGSVMIESALVLLVYGVLMAGIMELGVVGFAVNSVSFAAYRAARFASLRGSGSGHPATAADIQASATGYAAPLSSGALTVAVTWTPDNHPGSTVQVKVSYNFKPAMLPVSAGVLTLQTTAREIIAQ